jgi:hypothetical protein
MRDVHIQPAVLTGTAVAYIVIAVVAMRLIATRVIAASFIPLLDAVAAIGLAAISLRFANPAGVPVVGLAFAAVGLVRESRESRRIPVFMLLAIGAILCAYATFIALIHANHE